MSPSPFDTQFCPRCARPLFYAERYNSWYCNGCREYVHVFQPVYQQMYIPPPISAPTEEFARSKILNVFRMRGETDRHISQGWVPLIILLQILLFIFSMGALLYLTSDFLDFETNLVLNISDQTMFYIVMAFVFGVIMAVVNAILVYKLVKRRDGHFQRDALLRQGMIDHLISQSNSERKDLNVEIWTMNTIHQSANVEERERSPVKWALVIAILSLIPGVGLIVHIYVMYFLTKDAIVHHDRQTGLNHQFQTALVKLGKEPLDTRSWTPLPRRSTPVYMILSLLTIGFFVPYWWYVAIGDTNDHFVYQRSFENALVGRLGSPVREG